MEKGWFSAVVPLLFAVMVLSGHTGGSCVPVPVEPECPPVVCTLYCEWGFEIDEDGCEVCRCAEHPDYFACRSDQDCACGVDRETGECALGNRAFIDEDGQCPDFCEGIGGHLIILCEEERCVQRPFWDCRRHEDCMRTGCSGQICAPEMIATTCEWWPHYACYQESITTCGCYEGRCAFDATPELAECLANPPGS